MVALVIIYNHRFDKNIARLEELYEGRFSHIFHLMPFYNGEKENVIPVYEHSFYFQGYFAQAHKTLKAAGDFDDYFFVADDVLLPREVNENNYQEFLGLKPGDSFTTYIREFPEAGNDLDLFLLHKAQHYEYPPTPGRGLEIVDQLPSRDEALETFEKKGYKEPKLYTNQLYSYPKRTDFKSGLIGSYFYRQRIKKVDALRKNEFTGMPYPLVKGFADMLVIPKDEIDKFCWYCGLFAASRLFVEYAVPTIMIMVCKNIVTEDSISKKSLLLWNDDREKFEAKYNNSLTTLFDNYPEETLYVHPVKFSKWTK